MSLATFFGQMFANLKTFWMVAFENKVLELKGRYQNEKKGEKRGKQGWGSYPNPNSMFFLFLYRWDCYKMTESDPKNW